MTTEKPVVTIIVSNKKPVLNYVTACITAFNSGYGKVLLRARGFSINNAVDTVRLLKTGFLPDLRVEDVRVGSEDVEQNGKTKKVAYITILISKEKNEGKPESNAQRNQ